MLTEQENERLCRVGPATPMGEVLRRYWLPVLLSSDVEKADGDPVRVRLLGEDFVAFRDSNGQVGFMDEACAHRGASLWLGRVENGGIRCLYHGWKYAADGTILETPNLPETSRFKEKVRAPAYPVREAGDLIWVYIGPPELRPSFPQFAFMSVPREHRAAFRMIQSANWVQVLEGTFDPSHTGILHADYNPFGSVNQFNVGETQDERLTTLLHTAETLRSADNAPVLTVENTEFGFHVAAIRKPLDGGTSRYVRVSAFVMPFFTLMPPADRVGAFCVPLDDEHTAYISVTWDRENPVDPAPARAWYGLDQPSLWDGATSRSSLANRYMQDRSRMRESFTGMPAVAFEDMAVTASMGAIVDRTREHLVPGDLAVIRARRILLSATEDVRAGREPLGVSLRAPAEIQAGEGMIAPGSDWHSLVPRNRTLEGAELVPEVTDD